MLVNVPAVHFLCVEGEECTVSLDTCAAGVAPRADELALVMLFLCAATAQT